MTELDSEPSFDDRFLNNLPDYVTATPVDDDPFERAAQRVRAPYEKANQRESGLPDVLNVIGGRIKSGLTAPRDALTGDLQINDPETNMPTQEAIGRAADVAGLATVGGIGGAEEGALGMTGGKIKTYHGEHTSPASDSGSPLHDVTANGTYPKDFYESKGFDYYRPHHEGDADINAYNKIKNAKDKPDEKIAIWRAIPYSGKGKDPVTRNSSNINSGDWVTINRQYAIDHGESALNGNYSIAKSMVPAKELFTAGDSFHEWGWHPEGNKLSASGLPVTFTPVDGDPHKSANTVGDAIDTAAKKYGINPTVLKGIASIESSWDPGSNRNKATQYKGLFQIGKEEWKQHGNGDIYNAKDNANAAAKMLSEHAQWFKDNYGREPTPGEFYMMHQQGRGFISNGTMTNIGGNPYPGMRGPQTPETFKQGWSDTLARKMAQFGGADSISNGTERVPSSNTKVASNSPTPTHKFTPVGFNPFDLVNHSNHVPYGAGASDTPSGYPVNIDKRIPQHNDELKLPDGEPADLHKYLTIHEIEEYKAMKNGVPYHKAHHDIATPMEKKAVESDGVDWKKYTHVMDGYLKKTEEEGYKDLPKGLYAKPYHSRSLIKPEPKTENGKQNA